MPKTLSMYLLLVLHTAGLYPLVALSQNNVVFLGSGYGGMCSQAAHAPDDSLRFAITGSRLSVSGIEVCGLAIAGVDQAPLDIAGSYNNRGVLHFSQEEFELALADFDAALEQVESLPQAHANRGYALAALQRWAESIEAFDRGLALDAPEPARIHFNRAIAHEELGNVRSAYEDYLRASELAPDWEDPKLELTRFSVR